MKDGDFSREQFQYNKPLPHSADAEIGLQGGILLDNDQMDSVAANLTAEDFYSPRQKIFFKAMYSLWQKKLVIDPITIANEMKAQGESIDSLGGVASITNLTLGLPHFSDLTDWIKIVKDKSIIRQIIKLCSYLIEISLSEGMTAEEILNYGEAQFYQIRDKNFNANTNQVAYPTLIENALKEIVRRSEIKDFQPGLKTGYADIDNILGGLQKAYIILAGATSMGKSSLATDLVTSICLQTPETVFAYFTLEMSKDEIIYKQISQLAQVENVRLRNGRLMKSEWKKVAEATAKLQYLNLIIDDTPSITPSYIRSKLRRIVKDKGRLDGVVIDHSGLMKPDVETKDEIVNINNISQDLFSLKKEFDIPVINLRQFSRKPDDRKSENFRPRKSDLKGSGNLEQDADDVWLVYREEYYHKTDQNAGKAELIIDKSRNSPVCNIPLTWMGFCTHFANRADN